MKNLTAEQLGQLGYLVDKADNYLALMMPFPAMHRNAVRHGLMEIRATLHELYVAIADDDPWAASEKE